MLSPNPDGLRRGVEISKIRRTRRACVSAPIACLVCSLFVMALAPSVIAQATTYIYTGAPFTDCSGPFRGIPGGCSPGATRITGSFTVAEPLPKNLFVPPCAPPNNCPASLARIFPLSFSFSDGNTTFTDKNVVSCGPGTPPPTGPCVPGTPYFAFMTDAQGRISQWTFDLQTATESIDSVCAVRPSGSCLQPNEDPGNEVDDSIPLGSGSNLASWSTLNGTWRLAAFSLVDPVASFGHPSLVDDRGIVDDPQRIAASTQTVNGVAADGATQAVVRFANKGGKPGDEVQFSLYNDQSVPALSNARTEDGYLSSLDGTVTGNTITVPTISTVTTIGSISSIDLTTFAIYHAPIDFVRANNQNDPAATNRAVTIRIQNLPGVAGNVFDFTGNVQIVRPPVALIHGLWSDRSTWDFFNPLTFSNGQSDSRFQTYRIDYKEHNGDNVDIIVSSPGGPIDQLLSDLADFKVRLNVAAIQFDVVAHSMGGLVTRDMTLNKRFLAVSNFNKGFVHKLITIGTPHNGSPLVNELNASGIVCKKLFGLAGQKVAGAVEDLSVGSSFLAKVNGSPQPPPLRAHAIVGIANLNQQISSQTGLGHITQFVCQNVLPLGYRFLYGGDDSDLLVPETSQHFNFFPTATFETVSNTIHSVAPVFFPEGPDELNRVLTFSDSLALNPVPTSDPAIDPNRVINGLNTPISDTSYFADIKP
jgi:pimeloyl-ACP methyl ester carboxylesterase